MHPIAPPRPAEPVPSTVPCDSPDITRWLQDWSEGDPEALDRLVAELSDDLRRLARAQFARESPGHTLQPTGLVNEVYLRLVQQRRIHWADRGRFFAFAAILMRRILVSHARKRRAAKRGGDAQAVTLCEGLVGDGRESVKVDLLALDQALDRLASLDARQARVVELRYFAGLTVRETARALDIAPSTVKLDWSLAKAWLFRELAGAQTAKDAP